MPSVEMSNIDLECARRHSSSADSDGESLCFSEVDGGSCHSQFYSIADGSYDDCRFACGSDLEAGRVSVSDSECSVDIDNGVGDIKLHLEKEERDCRICHLSLESTNPESGIGIELGCSCKDDLAVAHKNCAEAWFKIKGNKTCEICNSIARNVLGVNEIESTTQQTNEISVVSVSQPQVPRTAETRRCLNGHRIVNFLLACMVCAFIISWLFHFNIPS
ncbi:RING/FYVE/PHD zinc finger superfamily protein [Actinidia rufa]|uniref:RING/FYVE/PHD zinc finger superfamily protein n=1 Tax=Actinidia rufa TaxID=165716 RepID=A0A7J0EB31_9ERIC|nr:RING/FYVE/PHD zinc finger superfamily protein [Actinidia rufa]